MSLKSVLSKIWYSIKNLFSTLPADLKTAIHIGVVVTEKFKEFVDSDYADLLVAIIPGNYDNYLLELLRSALPAIFRNLKLVEQNAVYTNFNDLLKDAIKAYNDLPEAVKPAWSHNLSILIAQAASDGKLTWSDGVYLLEWYYKTEFKEPANNA